MEIVYIILCGQNCILTSQLYLIPLDVIPLKELFQSAESILRLGCCLQAFTELCIHVLDVPSVRDQSSSLGNIGRFLQPDESRTGFNLLNNQVQVVDAHICSSS